MLTDLKESNKKQFLTSTRKTKKNVNNRVEGRCLVLRCRLVKENLNVLLLGVGHLLSFRCQQVRFRDTQDKKLYLLRCAQAGQGASPQPGQTGPRPP